MGKTLLEATVKETKKCRYPSKFYVSSFIYTELSHGGHDGKMINRSFSKLAIVSASRSGVRTGGDVVGGNVDSRLQKIQRLLRVPGELACCSTCHAHVL